MKKRFVFMLALLAAAMIFCSCASRVEETKATHGGAKVQISGSTSMESVANALAEAYMQENAGVSVDVQLGGSSVGAQDALIGKSDIGNVSRPLNEKESDLIATTMAIDGIAVIGNAQNGVADLTKDNVRDIYTRKIINWKQLGGQDRPIVVIGREAASGTRGAFEELLGIKEQATYAQELNETGAVKTSVANTLGAIGYISLEALDESVLALNVDGYPPTEEAIKAGDYPLSRPYIMATNKQPSEQTQKFLEFVLSGEGQAIVRSNDLIPVK